MLEEEISLISINEFDRQFMGDPTYARRRNFVDKYRGLCSKKKCIEALDHVYGNTFLHKILYCDLLEEITARVIE